MSQDNETTIDGITKELKPLVLLDVDGVINDLGSLYGVPREWRIAEVAANGFLVHIPEYMPALVKRIDEIADIYWCTTWRHRANDEIVTHLGVGPFPVVDDGTSRRVTSWKAAAAYELAADALDAGRRVIWIEDFYGAPPADEMPEGTEFVDTAATGFDAVLTTEMLSDVLSVGGAV